MKRVRVFERKAIDTEHDPYLTGEAAEDMAACHGCGLVFHGKRWYRVGDLPKGLSDKIRHDTATLCPACRKERDRYPEGFIIIEGPFTKEHREEIIHLIRNKEQRASHFNPLERIMEIKEKDDSLEVTTTTEKLAQRIGQMLEKAYKKDAEFKWSSDTKIARVVWRRTDGPKEV